MTPTPAQLRHACGLLRWGPLMLAWNAKTSHDSAGKICMGYDTSSVPEEHIQAIQGALEAAGVEFDDGGSGVRLRKGEQKDGER